MDTKIEIWRDINGHVGHYQISDAGKVKNVRTGRIMKIRVIVGYPALNIFVNRTRITKYIHRLIAEAFIPNPENLPEVNHINADRSDHRITNLEWVSRKENIRHSYRLNRKNFKNNIGKSTLTSELRETIIDHHRAGLSQRKIGVIVGAAPTIVGKILRNQIVAI